MMFRFFSFILIAMAVGVMSAVAAELSDQTGPVPTVAAVPAPEKVSEVCDITGIVSKMQVVNRSPWTDGTPTTQTTLETHIAVTIDGRKPHRNGAPAAHPCNQQMPQNAVMVYKLCSTTPVQEGDRIIGTEGLDTGSEKVVGCLLDLIVLPPKEDAQKG